MKPSGVPGEYPIVCVPLSLFKQQPQRLAENRSVRLTAETMRAVGGGPAIGALARSVG